MRALDYDCSEALLAAPFAFSAKLVVLLPSSFIKKECPFFLEVLRHTGHTHHLLSVPQPCDCSPERRNAQNLSELFVFGVILGVILRCERRSG
jgi:hypothetical protein